MNLGEKKIPTVLLKTKFECRSTIQLLKGIISKVCPTLPQDSLNKNRIISKINSYKEFALKK